MQRRKFMICGTGVALAMSLGSAHADEKTGMRHIYNGDIRIQTEAFGRSEDPALLLIMGATASMLAWPDPLCRALADRGLFVIRFDHRDTGGSTTVPLGDATYAVEDMASDVIAILDGYGIRQVHLMGMSLGGYIAQMLALTHQDRIHSLILVASEPLGWDGSPLPYISQEILDHFASMATIDWTDRGAVAEFLLHLERLNAVSFDDGDAIEARDRISQVLSRTLNAPSMFNHASVATRNEWVGGYREINLPTLVIHGELDPVLPIENGQALANAISNAKFSILPGVGHGLPRRVHSEIVDLVTSHILGTIS